jgi:histidinol-phosphate aminotransferase
MLRPRANIENLFSPTHGGIDYPELQKLGKLPKEILDFSVSTNPFGPPPDFRRALYEASVDNYPDSHSTELRLMLSHKLGISTENLLIGSGSTELIRLVSMAYFSPDDTVVILQPTYSEYEFSCSIMNAKVIKQLMTEESGFRLDLHEVTKLIRRHHPKGIFICNPNNPTGQYLSKDDVREILSISKDSLVILDEAYIAFTENTWASQELISGNNLLILRSMTKDYALAGLRLGYGIAPEAIISVLSRIKPPWNVSSVAQKAGIHALNADGYLEISHAKIKESKEFLVHSLRRVGLTPLPSQANFFLIKVGNATAFRQVLLKRGILVRDCTSFGLPDYIRLAARPINECTRLIAAIKDTALNQNVR